MRHNTCARKVIGFTLVELLVVLGIISFLIGLLLPCLSAARGSARTVKCASNVKQLCAALYIYASEHKGRFPPNLDTPSPGLFWYDANRIGQYLQDQAHLATGIGGGVLVCPEDEGAQRSYAMNVWASSIASDTAIGGMPVRGQLWAPGSAPSSKVILMAERWSSGGSAAAGYCAPATLGALGDKPGQRFGAGGGLSPLISAGRFGDVNCELPYMRHRRQSSSGSGTQPIGRVNIGYADGHVELKSESDLADRATGRSTFDSLWSTLDQDLDK